MRFMVCSGNAKGNGRNDKGEFFASRPVSESFWSTQETAVLTKLRPDATDITQRQTERGGFEPPVPLSEDTAFPVLHNRPLCHLSQSARGRGYSAFSFAFFSLGAFSLGALSLEALSL